MMPSFDRTDHLAALGLGLLGLLVYGRTLAPGLLFGDSAEFQTLAQTLGLAHVSGYSTYVLISHLLTYLPIGTLAWRVNALSAVAAVGTLVGVFYLIRYLTTSRVGGILAAVGLLLSYTFWSQAIIAETYTLGTLWWVLITLLIWRWFCVDAGQPWLLFAAAFLFMLGYGVHLYVLLLAPAMLALVLWGVFGKKRPFLPTFRALASGGLLGGLLLLFCIFLLDRLGSQTSPMIISLRPYYTAWELMPETFATFWGRLWLLLSNPQWGGDLFAMGWDGMVEQSRLFGIQLAVHEFSWLLLAAAGFGGIVLWWLGREKRPFLLYLLLAGGLNFILAVGYAPADWHLFFLPVLLVIVILAGVSLGQLELLLARRLPATTRWGAMLVLLLLLGQGLWSSRLSALRAGEAFFVFHTYPYPVGELEAPRERAEALTAALPPNGVMIMDWRWLYSAIYVTHVENGLTDTRFIELQPYGTDEDDLEALAAVVDAYRAEERPIFVDRRITVPGYRTRWEGNRSELVPRRSPLVTAP